MKKIILIILFFGLFLVISPALAKGVPGWKPKNPDGFTPITWVKAPGIASFFKAPSGNGSMDFITRIYLPQNQIQFIASSSVPLDWGVTDENFILANSTSSNNQTVNNVSIYSNSSTASTSSASAATSSTLNVFHNFAFARFVAEAGKHVVSAVKFIWSGPFFNITIPTSDLSFALKSTMGTTTLISSGRRSDFDLSEERRMLLINNHLGVASIKNFDQEIFISDASGDQGIEGFAPSVVKNDNANGIAARLFFGVTSNGQELVVYCSRGATVKEASDALLAAGITPENQFQADGGGSATCGYNLPGHFFVEPSRTIPLLMGATTVLGRGISIVNPLNVRSGPGVNNKIVARLTKGAKIIIFQEKNGWIRIGEKQWVLAKNVKRK